MVEVAQLQGTPVMPTPLKIKPEGIPSVIRERNQWIGWKYEWNGKKWTKPPFHVSGNFKASTTNATTWSTFEEAYAGYLAGNIDGIGYVFGQDDGLVGIDVDHCIDVVSKNRGRILYWQLKTGYQKKWDLLFH